MPTRQRENNVAIAKGNGFYLHAADCICIHTFFFSGYVIDFGDGMFTDYVAAAVYRYQCNNGWLQPIDKHQVHGHFFHADIIDNGSDTDHP